MHVCKYPYFIVCFINLITKMWKFLLLNFYCCQLTNEIYFNYLSSLQNVLPKNMLQGEFKLLVDILYLV